MQSDGDTAMKHETLAPWGEPVPGDTPMTADDLLALDDSAWQYELVNGRLLRMAPTGLEHFDVTQKLYRKVDRYVEERQLGIVTLPDTGFAFSRPDAADTVLSPDLAFVSAARVAQLPAPGSPERRKYLRVVPDLVVEVASPDQFHPEMAAKARLYLELGVPLVWVVWPALRQVDVWRAGASDPVATLDGGATLEGGDTLVGFTYPLGQLFAGM